MKRVTPAELVSDDQSAVERDKSGVVQGRQIAGISISSLTERSFAHWSVTITDQTHNWSVRQDARVERAKAWLVTRDQAIFQAIALPG